MVVLTAEDVVASDLPRAQHAAMLERVSSDHRRTLGLFKELRVAEGLPVEVVLNLAVNEGLTNGSDGTLVRIGRDAPDAEPSTLWVEFNDETVGQQRSKEASIKHMAKAHGLPCGSKAVPIHRVGRKFQVGNRQSVHVVRRQFPIRVAAARTFNRVQVGAGPSRALGACIAMFLTCMGPKLNPLSYHHARNVGAP